MSRCSSEGRGTAPKDGVAGRSHLHAWNGETQDAGGAVTASAEPRRTEDCHHHHDQTLDLLSLGSLTSEMFTPSLKQPSLLTLHAASGLFSLRLPPHLASPRPHRGLRFQGHDIRGTSPAGCILTCRCTLSTAGQRPATMQSALAPGQVSSPFSGPSVLSLASLCCPGWRSPSEPPQTSSWMVTSLPLRTTPASPAEPKRQKAETPSFLSHPVSKCSPSSSLQLQGPWFHILSRPIPPPMPRACPSHGLWDLTLH